MEDRGDAARHGGHDPHPVCRTAPPAAVFILHVLNEGLGGRVVVDDGHFVTLWWRGDRSQEVRELGCFRILPQSGVSRRTGLGDGLVPNTCLHFSF